MTTIDEAVEALHRLDCRPKRNGRGGYDARCPMSSHDDRKPSFTASEGREGQLLMSCRGCEASFADLLDALGLRNGTQREHVETHGLKLIPGAKAWWYRDSQGAVVGVALRIDGPDGKTFRQARCVAGTWEWKAMEAPRPLYRLPQLLARPDAIVLVCEGEKAADAAAAALPRDYVVVTSIGGAKGAAKADWSPLAGRDLICWPDADTPGLQYMHDVARLAQPRSVRWVAIPGNVAEGWDAADATPEQIRELVERQPGEDDERDAGPGEPPSKPEPPRRRPLIVMASDVVTELVHWVWNRRLARGTIGLLCGDPGLGKSTVSYDLAARITIGVAMPGDSDDLDREPGDVVVLTAEDSLKMTAVPRLERHHANLGRVAFLEAIVELDGTEQHVDLSRDLAQVEEALDALPNPRLVVIDPLDAYLGNVNTWKTADLRRVIGPIAKLADRRGIAIVAVLHLTKDSQRQALYRVQGSIGYVAAARTVLAVGIHPDDHEKPKPEARRIVVNVKNNLAPEANAIVFRVGGGVIEWGEEIEGAADTLLAAPAPPTKKRDGKGEKAETAIMDELADGAAHLADEIVSLVERTTGASRASIYRVRKMLVDLGSMRCWSVGFPPQAWWQATHGSVSETIGGTGDSPGCDAEHPIVSPLEHETNGQTDTQVPLAVVLPIVSQARQSTENDGADLIAEMTKRNMARLATACRECGVRLDEPTDDGLCGSNCRAIVAERGE